MNTLLVEPCRFLLVASAGQSVVIGVYLLLLIGIVWMPRVLLDPTQQPVPWWKNLRFWAAVICGVQIMVYALLG